jgi:hypothetical protein
MKMSQLLAISEAIDKKIARPTNVLEEIHKESAEAQKLAADVFAELARMLVSNDGITMMLAMALDLIADSAGDAALRFLKKMVRTVSRERSLVVKEARKYQNLGCALNSGQVPAI